MLGLPKPTEFEAKHAAALIAAFTVIRIVIALVFPPTIDESYAIAVSRQWSLSYFDHPPLGFTIARIVAFIAQSEAIWLIRLPFIAMGAISAWLIYFIARTIYDDAAAYWALAWFLVAPFFLISAGHFVVPDGPLNLLLLTAFASVLPILLYDKTGAQWGPWLGFGLFLGLALSAKYQAVLFGVSILLFLLTTAFGRDQLKTAPPWVAAAIAACGLVPMLVWNAQNDFVSFKFQSARATEDFGLQPQNFLLTMAGQAIYLLPGTFIVALIVTPKRLFTSVSSAQSALAWIVAVPFIVFATIALFSTKSLPHWPMAGFLFAFPLVGKWCSENVDRWGRFMNQSLKTAMVGLPILAIVVGLQANYGVLTRGFTDEKTQLDFDWRLASMPDLKSQIASVEDQRTVFTRNWARAAKLVHALGPEYEVIPMTDPRHFQYAEVQAPANGLFVDFVGHRIDENTATHQDSTITELGLTPAGQTQFLPQKTGAIVRFQVAVTPVSN